MLPTHSVYRFFRCAVAWLGWVLVGLWLLSLFLGMAFVSSRRRR
jgi:hypothetical protein